jgi:hypothetical protein
MTQPWRRRILLLAWLLGAPLCIRAAGESAVFNLTIQLGEVCRSEVWSEKTQAEVKVICRTGDFVQIEPTPGKPFLGTHGSAHRFHMSANALPSGVLMANMDASLGAGTVTSLRVYNISGSDGPLEMLVTF